MADKRGLDLNSSMPRLLTIPEAATELGVPPGSLRTAAQKHGFLVRFGRTLRIDPETLPELIEKCRDQPKDRGCINTETAAATMSFATPEAGSSQRALEIAEKLKRTS